jgi:hypothetical protein
MSERLEPAADQDIAYVQLGQIDAMAAMPDGRVATANSSRYEAGLVIWPVPADGGEPEPPVELFPHGGVADATALPDGRPVVAGWKDGLLHIVDPTGQFLDETIASAAEAVTATTTTDGTNLVAALGPNGGVTVWSYRSS